MYGLRNKLLITSVFVLFALNVFAQPKNERFVLDRELAEVSGLLIWGDTSFLAINDGGSGPYLYCLNLQGEIKTKWQLSQTENRDWEALASDDKNLYIGDFGNNRNRRRDLCVYKVPLDSLDHQTIVSAEKIEFSYADQLDFPPRRSERRYDSEAMTFFNDSLWIFSKNRVFFNRYTDVYALPVKAGNHVLAKRARIKTGMGHWFLNAITAADSFGDTILLTGYKKMMLVRLEGTEFRTLQRKHFFFIRQREAIATKDGVTVFVANERNRLIGRMKLYKMIWKHA